MLGGCNMAVDEFGNKNVSRSNDWRDKSESAHSFEGCIVRVGGGGYCSRAGKMVLLKIVGEVVAFAWLGDELLVEPSSQPRALSGGHFDGRPMLASS